MSVAIVAGGSKGIGLALARQMASNPALTVLALSRTGSAAQDHPRIRHVAMDLAREEDIEKVAQLVKRDYGDKQLKAVWMAAGFLEPEKALRGFTEEGIMNHLRINTIAPMLAAKHWHSLLQPAKRPAAGSAPLVGWEQSWWVNMSARTGSIGDNKLGGWYSYRISKAALNQLTRTMAVELGRSGISVVSLHPGTVETDLSRPYVSKSAAHPLFTPDESAEKLHQLVSRLSSADSGGFFDYKGDPIVW